LTPVTIALLKPFKDSVLSITADNGKEFAYHKEVSKALDCDYFFADPYCSWQRGLNENTNGLLRQYWPKSTNFKLILDEDVDRNLIQLNNVAILATYPIFYKAPSCLLFFTPRTIFFSFLRQKFKPLNSP
jgi:hypothetical protein